MTGKLGRGWAEAGGRALAEAERNGADVGLVRGARRPQPWIYPTSLPMRRAKKGRAAQLTAKALDAALGKVEEP